MDFPESLRGKLPIAKYSPTMKLGTKKRGLMRIPFEQAFPKSLQKLREDHGVTLSYAVHVFDFGSTNTLKELIQGVDDIEPPYSGGMYNESCFPILKEILADLTALLSSTDDDVSQAQIYFLRFYVTLPWLGYLTIARRFPEMWQCLMSTLVLDYNGPQSAMIDLEKILEMLELIDKNLKTLFTDLICLEWFSHFFYYTNNMGDLKHIGHVVFSYCKFKSINAPLDDTVVTLICHLIKFAQTEIPLAVDGLVLYLHANFEKKNFQKNLTKMLDFC
jgi:hypothetical protein